MISNTDLIILIALMIAVFRGWRKGIVQSLISPLALAISFLIGLIYFEAEQNLIKSLFLISFFTLALSFGAFFFLAWGRRSLISKEDQEFVFWGSRLLGIIVNVLCQGGVLSCILTLLVLAPADIFKTQAIQNDILASNSYHLAQIYYIDRIPVLRNFKKTIEVFGTPAQFIEFKETPAFQKILNHPKVQAAIADEETQTQIQNKDIIGLLRNPKIKDLIDDRALMKQFSAVTRNVYSEKRKEMQEEIKFRKKLEEQN